MIDSAESHPITLYQVPGAAPTDIAKVLGLRKGTPLLALEHSFYFARAESYKFSLTVRGKLPITRSLKIAN